MDTTIYLIRYLCLGTVALTQYLGGKLTLRTNISISYEEHESLVVLLDLVESISSDPTKAQEVLDLFREHNSLEPGQLASRVISGMAHALYEEYCRLPPGDHLKIKYEDLVWTLDDRDIESLAKANAIKAEEG